MAGSMRERDRRLAELKAEVTKRGFDRYPSLLDDIAGLPADLRSPALESLAAGECIQTIISFPAQIQRGWHYVPKQALLFTGRGVIHLLASIWPGQEPQLTPMVGCDLFYVKVSLLLLYGLMEIVARSKDSPVHLGLEFNTVAWSYLARPVHRLLQTAISTAAVNRADPASAAVRASGELPLKFANGVRIYGLLPGQSMESLIFQPRVETRWRYLLRRTLIPNTLILFTNDFLVIIQEETRVEQGWILTYIPLECIREIQNRPDPRWSEISLQLQRENQRAEYRLVLKNEATQTLQAQWIRRGGRWQDHVAADEEI